MNQNNLVQEIGLIAISVAIVAGAVVLLALGKIDYAECAGMIGVVVALWGANSLYKAPSPSQQQQIGNQQNQVLSQQQQLQQLVSYALGMVSGLVQQPQAPVAPLQGQQTAQPVQVQSPPVPVPVVPAVVPPGANPVPGTPPMQTQFKSIVIPDVSMPMSAVGQGIPLGQ